MWDLIVSIPDQCLSKYVFNLLLISNIILLVTLNRSQRENVLGFRTIWKFTRMPSGTGKGYFYNIY